MNEESPSYILKTQYGIDTCCEFNGLPFDNCVESKIPLDERTGLALRNNGGEKYRLEVERLRRLLDEGFRSVYLYTEDGIITYAQDINTEIETH